MNFVKNLFRGFMLAAYFTLFFYETAGLCSSFSAPPAKIDGYCTPIAGFGGNFLCRDSGCSKRYEKVRECRKISVKDSSSEECDCVSIYK